MSSRTSITILYETKKALETLKGEESWDEFLLRLIAEVQRFRREKQENSSEIFETEHDKVKIKKWAKIILLDVDVLIDYYKEKIDLPPGNIYSISTITLYEYIMRNQET